MNSTKQPSLEKLKKSTIYLRYLVADMPPKEGFKRMTYYTELHDKPGKIYYGLSFRRPEDPNRLRYLVETGQIIQLSKPEILPYEKDVWLDENGKVYLLKGYAPWEDFKEARPFAAPEELDPARIKIGMLHTKPKPYHELTP